MTLNTSAQPAMAMSSTRRIRYGVRIALESTIGVVVFVLAWAAASGMVRNPSVLPSPELVLRALSELLAAGEIFTDVGVSLAHLGSGYLIGVAGGLVLAVLTARYAGFGEFAEPVVELLRPISAIAWIPIAILIFGVSDGVPVFLIAYAAAFPIFVSMLDGIRRLDVSLVNAAKALGPAYDGPEGKGAGHKVASFSKTPLAPEAYYPHRVWWVVRQDFLKSNPKEVQAFLMANARAVEAMSAMPAPQFVSVYGKDFPGNPQVQAEHIEHMLWRGRGWPWITEGDVRTLAILSQTKALFPTPLDAANVRKVVAMGADVCKAAWLATGSKPPRAAFDVKKPSDPRGRPVWEIDAWAA